MAARTHSRLEAKEARPVRRATQDSVFTRGLLIAIALGFVGLFLVVPLAAVFTEALRKGLGAYFKALTEPEARAAIKLTLIAAGIAVPLNVVFGIAASWAITKFSFPGKS